MDVICLGLIVYDIAATPVSVDVMKKDVTLVKNIAAFNGGDAMNAYATLHEQNPGEIAEIRKALLKYCRLDTLAMVKVLGKLYEVVGGCNYSIRLKKP